MGNGRKLNITTKEFIEELKCRGKTPDEIFEFLYPDERELVENLKRRGKTSEEILEFLYSKEEEKNSVSLNEKVGIQDNSFEEIVTNVLLQIGVPTHLKGFNYLRHAILLVLEDSSYKEGITTSLYPKIAKEFNSTTARIERDIRHGIEHAWKIRNDEVWRLYFGHTINKKQPTNAHFISALTDRIKIKYQ